MLPIFLVIPTKLIPLTKDAAGNMFGGGGLWVIISSVYSCLYPNLFGEQSRPRKIHHPVVTTTTYSLIWWTIMSCTRYVSLHIYICRSTPTSLSHKRKRRKKKRMLKRSHQWHLSTPQDPLAIIQHLRPVLNDHDRQYNAIVLHHT